MDANAAQPLGPGFERIEQADRLTVRDRNDELGALGHDVGEPFGEFLDRSDAGVVGPEPTAEFGVAELHGLGLPGDRLAAQQLLLDWRDRTSPIKLELDAPH